MSEKIGSLIIAVAGLELSADEKEVIAHPLVGGVILFARNYASRAQLKNLTHTIRQCRATPLLIMVDQEGGRVQRFIEEFTRLPPMAEFGSLYDTQPEKALADAKNCGQLMATELLAMDVDLSLAPVLDLDKGINTAIGTRAFHKDPHIVTLLAKSFIHGMRAAGMAATGKHFPGHGSVAVDSHKALPMDERPLEEIEKEDLLSFINLNKELSAIMAAHIVFPNIDTLAVGYSPKWLQTLLRKKYQFNGIIFSDDLNMEGANISANYNDRFIQSRNAGCDFVLLCNNMPGVVQVLDHVPHATHAISSEKWRVLKGKTHAN